MSKFKVGDRVKCIRVDGAGGITLGNMYEVVGFDFQDDPRIVNDNGTRICYMKNRFELAESEKEPEPAKPQIFEYKGRKYRYATEADVGKTAWFDDRPISAKVPVSEYTECENVASGTLKIKAGIDFRFADLESNIGWRYAIVDCTDEQPKYRPFGPADVEPKFKVGQLIRCKTKAEDLTIGFLYEVLSHDPEGDPYVENDEEDSKPYSSTLFRDSQEPWETSPFNADYASIEQSVQSTIDRSSLIYNYLDAQAAFERASTAYNEACQAIRDKLKDGERFVYTRYSEAYIVQRDKDGFTVERIDMV